MSNETKEKVLSEWSGICDAAEAAMSEWSGKGNLQFPVLLGIMAIKLNWDEKQVRRADPFVREYIRNHSDWHVTRGAGGGIMRASEKQKKDDLKLSKDIAKKQIEDALEAQALAAKTTVDSDS